MKWWDEPKVQRTNRYQVPPEKEVLWISLSIYMERNLWRAEGMVGNGTTRRKTEKCDETETEKCSHTHTHRAKKKKIERYEKREGKHGTET